MMSMTRPGVVVDVRPVSAGVVTVGVRKHSVLDFRVYLSLHFVQMSILASQVWQFSTAHFEQVLPSALRTKLGSHAVQVSVELQVRQLSGH